MFKSFGVAQVENGKYNLISKDDESATTVRKWNEQKRTKISLMLKCTSKCLRGNNRVKWRSAAGTPTALEDSCVSHSNHTLTITHRKMVEGAIPGLGPLCVELAWCSCVCMQGELGALQFSQVSVRMVVCLSRVSGSAMNWRMSREWRCLYLMPAGIDSSRPHHPERMRSDYGT